MQPSQEPNRRRPGISSARTGLRHALAGAALAALSTGAAAREAAPPDHPPPPPRLISVNGASEVSVAPDRARLSVGVTQVNPEVATAEAAVNKTVKAFVAEARKLGARDEHIATAGISIQPEYVWDEKTRVNRLTGYRVSRDIEVRIDDLDKLGDYLLAATRAGVNQVQPPVLESSKAEDLKQQALAQAAQNAQAKAALLAKTLGVKLGNVFSLSEAGTIEPPRPMMKVMAMAAREADSGNAEMGLQTGEIRYGANVSAQFEVEP